MRNLNRDAATRDKMIFGEFNPDEYHGGIRYFEGLKLDTLKALLEKNFIEATESQNGAPTTEQILNFIEHYPDYTVHGYTVSPERSDYRITLEGVEKGDGADSPQELQDFTQLFKDADFIDSATMYCWFD